MQCLRPVVRPLLILYILLHCRPMGRKGQSVNASDQLFDKLFDRLLTTAGSVASVTVQAITLQGPVRASVNASGQLFI